MIMTKIKISEPTNCQCCGNEFNSYQLKMAKVNNKVLDICPKCNEIYTSYIEAASLLKVSQEVPDLALSSPNVVVEPMQPVIQKAVEVLKRLESNYFVGTRKIKAGISGSAFGFVQSGPDKDPAVINLNLAMISQKAKEYNMSPVFAAAITIAHEKGHVKSFNQQQGFVGGEGPAEAEEKRIATLIEQNKDRLKDLDIG
jgi:hypothetical protein